MIIIPARLASTRFPEKILADINGLPMVVATANRVKEVDTVAIATDSDRVVSICKKYGFEAIITSEEHQSGTDRINEAAKILGLKDDEVVINVQADEPFIEPFIVKSVLEKVKSENAFMVSAYKKVDNTSANDPNLVKVVVNKDGYALYFSRSKIPYDRDTCDEYCGHLGIYGFTCKNLEIFCALKTAPLEEVEKLEQLRALYHGKNIYMVEVESESFGIDTKEDLESALKLFKN